MTTNGGNSWEISNETSKAWDEKIQFIDPLNGFIIGGDLFLKTSDGGFTWKKKALNYLAENIHFQSIRFKNINEGIISGYREVYNYLFGSSGRYAVAFRTSDGGDSWQSVFGFYESALVDMAFINDSFGYMSTVTGKIYTTTNFGITWDSFASSGYSIAKISFADSLKGLAIYNHDILRTTDGGKKWEKIYTTKEYATDVKYFNDSLALVCTNWSTVYFSEDKGKTWMVKYKLEPFRTLAFNTLFILDRNTFFAAGDYGAFAKTTNDGQTWISNYDEHPDPFWGVSFINPNVGIAAGGNIFAITKNGGKNWAIKKIPFAAPVYGCKMLDSLRLFLQTEAGSIYYSFDGGETWTENNFGNGIYLTQMCFHNETGFIIGLDGILFKTTDYGVNWKKLDAFTDKDLINMVWIDASTFLMAGGDHSIFRTTDAGDNWQESILADSWIGHGMARLNSHTAILATGGQDILKTTDTGLSWTSIWVGSEISAISFCDSLNGYLLKSNQYIYRTRNGGLTWINEASEPNLGGIEMVDTTTAFAVGLYGAILSTNNFGLLDAKSSQNNTPKDILLSKNFPNPFNPSTTIKYSVPYECRVTLTVYNSLGQNIIDLVNEIKPAGNYEKVFNASGLSSGIYFYSLNAGKYSQVKKLLLLK